MAKLNVPEMFYQYFVKPLDTDKDLATKIENVEPKAKGRGLTRVVEVTETEWNRLFDIAKDASKYKGKSKQGRETILRASISARAMVNRMEKDYHRQSFGKPVIIEDTEDSTETTELENVYKAIMNG